MQQELTAAGLRVEGDYRAEKLGAKIRTAELEKVPYMFVIGEKDQNAQTVSLRDRIDKDLGAMPVADAISRLQSEISERTVRQTFGGSAGLGELNGRNEY